MKAKAKKVTAPTAALSLAKELSDFEAREKAWEAREKARKETAKKILEEIEVVHNINDSWPEVGFGYHKNELVEFDLTLRSLDAECVATGAWRKPITLADSLEWCIKMDFALERLGQCIQTGAAWTRWLYNLRTELN